MKCFQLSALKKEKLHNYRLLDKQWSQGRISENRKSSFSEDRNFLQLCSEDKKDPRDPRGLGYGSG